MIKVLPSGCQGNELAGFFFLARYKSVTVHHEQQPAPYCFCDTTLCRPGVASMHTPARRGGSIVSFKRRKQTKRTGDHMAVRGLSGV